MKVADLVRFGENYPDGHPYGVGMIVGNSKDMSHPPVCQSGENVLWKVLFATSVCSSRWPRRFQGWIRTDQLRVIYEGG